MFKTFNLTIGGEGQRRGRVRQRQASLGGEDQGGATGTTEAAGHVEQATPDGVHVSSLQGDTSGCSQGLVDIKS